MGIPIDWDLRGGCEGKDRYNKVLQAYKHGDNALCDRLCLAVLADPWCQTPLRLQANLVLLQTNNDARARLVEALRCATRFRDSIRSRNQPIPPSLAKFRVDVKMCIRRLDDPKHAGQEAQALEEARRRLRLPISANAAEAEEGDSRLASRAPAVPSSSSSAAGRHGSLSPNVPGQDPLSGIFSRDFALGAVATPSSIFQRSSEAHPRRLDALPPFFSQFPTPTGGAGQSSASDASSINIAPDADAAARSIVQQDGDSSHQQEGDTVNILFGIHPQPLEDPSLIPGLPMFPRDTGRGARNSGPRQESAIVSRMAGSRHTRAASEVSTPSISSISAARSRRRWRSEGAGQSFSPDPFSNEEILHLIERVRSVQHQQSVVQSQQTIGLRRELDVLDDSIRTQLEGSEGINYGSRFRQMFEQHGREVEGSEHSEEE
ncbi:MAG: hypothetical protein M1836_005812 [Candelina mexicana]|nr:MAG: hypothetical protein M1836_005812 [Candelina mexicana]